jgi:hypothetical protein
MADLRSVKTSGRFDIRSDDAAQFLVFRDNRDRFSPRQQRASTKPLLGHQLFQNRRSAIADRHYLTKIRNILSNPRIIAQSPKEGNSLQAHDLVNNQVRTLPRV